MQKVGTVAQRVATVGGLRLVRLRLNGLQSLGFQQFRDAIDATGYAARLQLDGDPPRAVAPLMLPEDVANERHEFSVSLVASSFDFGLPGVVTGAADFERIAHGRDGKCALKGELFDDRKRIG